MSGVLYKRIPPPPEPEDDPDLLSPTSPSGFETIDDGHIPDERDLNAKTCDDDDQNIHPNFDSMYNDDDDYAVHPDFDYNCNDDDEENTFSQEDLARQTNQYVTAALGHYNNQEGNQIKYELIKAITSAAIIDRRGFYGHVNFIAKSTLENSKEEFFFAELYHNRDRGIYMPTCIVSLEGKETSGGAWDIKLKDSYYGKEIRVDTNYCYACHEELKHPKDGTLYETGHQIDDYYGYSASY